MACVKYQGRGTNGEAAAIREKVKVGDMKIVPSNETVCSKRVFSKMNNIAIENKVSLDI